jgi:hypothetical protein
VRPKKWSLSKLAPPSIHPSINPAWWGWHVCWRAIGRGPLPPNWPIQHVVIGHINGRQRGEGRRRRRRRQCQMEAVGDGRGEILGFGSSRLSIPEAASGNLVLGPPLVYCQFGCIADHRIMQWGLNAIDDEGEVCLQHLLFLRRCIVKQHTRTHGAKIELASL